jgi:hypothetical protein
MLLRGSHPMIRGDVEVTIPDDSDLAQRIKSGGLHGLSIDLSVPVTSQEPNLMSRLSHDRPDDFEQVIEDAVDRADADRGSEAPVSDRTRAARAVACPACYAPAGEPCTQPTDNGRRAVGWHHLSREDAA